MTVGYKAVGWNRQKKVYDRVVVGALLAYLASFVAAGLLLRPNGTFETLLIRGLGTAALLQLHVVLAIGPLCRLDRRFLPLLYNRRHLGVSLFLTALAHGAFSIFQFHVLGDRNPLVSVLASNPRWDSLADFPFQPLGLLALGILFLMAATSHDFWLANLTAPVWKALHMAVYAAYALVLLHVALGVLQAETSPILVTVLALGAAVILGLHLAAAFRGRALDRASVSDRKDLMVDVCAVGDIPENRARIASVAGERVAVFRYDGKVSAISNVCKHQNGPLGEGRVVNGCVVCPWHGYEYDPATGASPPPFTESVPTFRVQVDGGRVLVDPRPNPPGTPVEPAPDPTGPGTVTDIDPGGDFYIGYKPQSAPALAAWTRKAVVFLFLLAVVVPWVLVTAESRFSDAVFEFGNVREFEGTVFESPYPVLRAEGADDNRPHLLVQYGKRGAADWVAGLDGQRVEAAGQLIYRDDQWMIELSEDSVQPISGPAAPAGEETSLGVHRLRGEIVGSKCFLGVMKPGRGKTHRACAVRCISGGVPPIFLVTDQRGERRYLLLVGEDRRPLNDEVLPWVAEPLEIEGEVTRSGELWYLRAEPRGFARLRNAG